MAQSRTSAPNDWREEAAAYLRSRGGHGSSSDVVNFEECGGDDSVFGSTVAEATAALPFVREGKEEEEAPRGIDVEMPAGQAATEVASGGEGTFEEAIFVTEVKFGETFSGRRK